MIYEYKCPTHPTVHKDSDVRADRVTLYCDFCQDFTTFHRVFRVAVKPSMQPHFNRSVGQPISNMTQFRDALKRRGEEMAEDKVFTMNDGTPIKVRGVETNYQPLEWGDHQAFGATNEGIHESNVERSKRGVPLLPEVK